MSTLTCLLSNCGITLILILVIVYFLGTYNHDFFKKQGVPYIKPCPVLGNMFKNVLRLKSIACVFSGLYNKFPEARFIGIFDFMKPVYLIRDPELIKQICIKDFDHFVNHRAQFDEELDPLFARNLFAMHDTKWKNMRSILSPAFTGSKMRLMFDLITDHCERAVETIAKSAKKNLFEVEMKDVTTRFGNDLVATCAFGIEINSFENRENEFYRQGKILTNLDGLQGLKFIGFSSFPKLMKLFRIRLFSQETVTFFRDIISKTIEHREKNNIVRHDMINLLLQAKNQKLKFEDTDKKYDKAGFATATNYDVGKSDDKAMKWTDDDVTAQCTVFFFGGFDTAATMSAFMGHELAVNPDVQELLRKEIDDVRAELKGKHPSYEIIQSMKYLDMVVSETLRKWGPALFIDRYCNKTFEMENNDGVKVVLQPGDGIIIPTLAIHNDAKYFPNPSKFDPERFSNENKGNIDPATFLTFGIGPRNCIGSRFALMECKAIFFFILSKFTLEMSKRTQHPLQFKISSLQPAAENGFWLNFRLRETK